MIIPTKVADSNETRVPAIPLVDGYQQQCTEERIPLPRMCPRWLGLIKGNERGLEVSVLGILKWLRGYPRLLL